MERVTSDSGDAGPWFWTLPVWAAVVAAAMFAAVTVMWWLADLSAGAVSMSFVLPVALTALTFGRGVGSAGGVAAFVVVGTPMVVSGSVPFTWGRLAVAVPLVLLGGLIGDAADRIRRSAEAERRAAAVRALQLEAAEINDVVLQQMAAAKWMLEAGRTADGIDTLAGSMAMAHDLVARMLGPGSVLRSDATGERRAARWTVEPVCGPPSGAAGSG